MAKQETRSLSPREARSLRPGDDHYTAYVGPPNQWDFMGATQFRLLTTLGLREHHKVLDVGCGSLRAGRFIIAYLEPGNYCGIEPNTWLIEDGIRNEVGESLIAIKKPRFNNSNDFETTSFGEEFDFIVAQSIFSHAGPDMVINALENFRAVLSEDGLILATFIHTDDAPDMKVEKEGWSYPECTSYRKASVENLIRDAKLVGRALPWYHPRQTWYAIGRTPAALPDRKHDSHLSGAVLRDSELESNSVA